MTTAHAHDWQQHAACLGSDPELFFPEGGGGQITANQAKQVCAGCPVQAECLAYALQHNIEQGIWGGTSEKERRALMPKRPEGRPVGDIRLIRHGTNGGYRSHGRRGEEPCTECRQAHVLYEQMRVENKRLGVGNHTNRMKTHCPAGHPYDEANTYWTSDGRRACRECKRRQP